ncbi:MAG: glycoside hydrolase family 15 protein [Polyangiaceae bacterium]
MIGDGRSVALVRVDGAIDWLCWPKFDSPSVFGAILDAERGGLTAVTPAQASFESLQRYDPDTNVLETLFTVPGQGTIRLTDFMPWNNDPRAAIHEIHRRIECLEGRVELDVVFDPRFGFGVETARFEQNEHGVLAHSPSGERLAAIVDDGASWVPRPRGGLTMRLSLTSGQRRWMVLSWDSVAPEPVHAYRPFEQLRSTRKAWRQWSARLAYDGPHRHHVLRSALCLKLLIYSPTGAMVAAPTTSLPEWIGNSRNWDYRYTWARDAALAIRAANLLGFTAEARDFFHFIRDTIDPKDGLQVMYSVDGGPVPEERILPHLKGYRGSLPVRVGNGAKDQIQLDTAGALVDAAHLFEHFGGSLTLRAWRKIQHVIEKVSHQWRDPDHGIWEPRAGKRHNVHSKMMCWLALDRGAGIASVFGATDAREAWESAAAAVVDEVCARGLDSEGRHFVAAYGHDHADAALLLLPIHGFLPDDHPLMHETVDWVRKELGTGPFVHRYRTDDGVGGAEGAFVLCGFWLAEALALQGRLEEAQEIFAAHAESSNHLGLLAEEVDPTTREQLGNFPQAFSHLGLINAALRIDLGLRLRDEGTGKTPHLIRDAPRLSRP